MSQCKKVLEYRGSKQIDPLDRNQCQRCGSKDLELRNYSMMWHDGDIYCSDCGNYVRGYDAG